VILKNSQYLSNNQLDDFLAIEALAFAVIEMRKREKDFSVFDEEADMAMAKSYAWHPVED